MTRSLVALATAMALVTPGGLLRAQESAPFRVTVSGFGTAAAAFSTEHQADFVGSLVQPNGAGHTANPSVGPDSKLGLQGQAAFGERLSSVVQVVASTNTTTATRRGSSGPTSSSNCGRT